MPVGEIIYIISPTGPAATPMLVWVEYSPEISPSLHWESILPRPGHKKVPRRSTGLGGHLFETPGQVFVPRSGHLFMPRSGNLFETPGQVFVPWSGHLLMPREGQLFVPRAGHEKVPRSGHFIETCSDYYYVQQSI